MAVRARIVARRSAGWLPLGRLLAGLACAALLAGAAHAGPRGGSQARKAAAAKVAPAPVDGEAEARLIEAYRLVGQARMREAFQKAEALVNDHPNFGLAQLLYGDLLSAKAGPLHSFGDVPDAELRGGAQALADLREESRLRLRALRERPPAGTIPAQFLQLSDKNRHAIAVDASRARLYLFENGPGGLKLVGDYYVSVGKLGIDKSTEGDLRTPLGVYFITSNLDRKSLKDFYGAGALPINYPNPYDTRRGKTGRGIWLHGTPPEQYSRAPKATDGCVVLANPDLERVIRSVEIRTTPVVIANSLRWVPQGSVLSEYRRFNDVLQSWRSAKSSGDMNRLLAFYTPDFNVNGKPIAERIGITKVELNKARGREIELKDVSLLRWTDGADTMVVTFGEVPAGARTGPVKRQYWVREGPQWKIFFEGVIG